MMNLKNLLSNLEVISVQGNPDRLIRMIRLDSRLVEPGDLFIAQQGVSSDGHKYIPGVEAAGATAIVCEVMPGSLQESICYIQVANSHEAAGRLASAYYGFPSRQLKLIGVTGTNGKTTIASLLFHLFTHYGYTCGLLSTVNYRIGQTNYPSTHTTPDAIRLNELLAEMTTAGCSHCFMEVSSHAIHQHRIAGLEFDGAIFTNITHDHLDYHGTFSEYIRVKKSWFDQLPVSAFSLINADDKNGKIMVQNTASRIHTYALKCDADFKGKVIEMLATGMQLNINSRELWVRLIGSFNASNLLAVHGAAVLAGIPESESLRIISTLTSVDGRFETIVSPDGVVAIIDYAHTPDALKNVLNTIAEIQNGKGQTITVFGAGGDRDRSKRPEMGAIASMLSSRIIITSDNPRSEEPDSILQQIKAGVPAANLKNSLLISDRREAIRTACMLAQPGDIILIAGKGHETYQEVKGVKHHFDDKEEVRKIFTEQV